MASGVAAERKNKTEAIIADSGDFGRNIRPQNGFNGTVISYSSQDLVQIPQKLICDEGFTNCTELYLDYNALTSLPESLPSNLPKLTKLSVIGNDLTSLPESIGQLSSLKELYLNENNLTVLPKSITKLKSLSVLQVVGNQLNCLPVDFGHLRSLVKLRMDENELKQLPESFGSLCNIQTVEISNNCLESLPKTFGQLERLRTLDLSENKLESLPASFSKLPSLTSLDLSENNLKALPNKFDSCDILTKLYLESNLLESIPPWFADLSCIMELSLKENQLHDSALPDNFGNSSQLLKFLDLSGNFMTNLPSTIGELVRLQFLHCGSVIGELERRNFQNGNWLSELPSNFGDLTKLTRLHLDENQLCALPENFGGLVSLKFLDLCQNRLHELPESFCNLANLKELHLSKNHLERLPGNFGKLGNLQDLRLDNNQLEGLPKSFMDLKSLKTLDLFNNCLGELPHVIQHLTNLVRLDLDQNGFKLNMMDVPQISHKLQYPERDEKSDEDGNWRNRIRQDMVDIEIEKVEATEEELNHLPDRDDTPPNGEMQYNSRLLKQAMRKSMSIWRKHTEPETREVYKQPDSENGSTQQQDVDTRQYRIDRKDKTKRRLKRDDSSSTLSTDSGPEMSPSDSFQSDHQGAVEEEEDWDKDCANVQTDYSPPRREVPQSQLLQSYIFGRYRQQGYKHDFEPSMIHPDPIGRQIGRFNVEDGQFDDADE